MKKRENGYLTVEAALVFPLVLTVQVLSICLFLFQYDRCLLNQDMARLTVLGCGSEEQEKNALAQYLKKCVGEIYLEKYVSWKMESVEAELTKNRICVKGQGMFRFPASDAGWDATAVYEAKKLQPVMLIRQYRKMKGVE